MNKNTSLIVGGIIVLALIVGGLVVFGGAPTSPTTTGPGELDAFAQCLKTNGVTFFGAFWCPHCQAQKKLFGNSVSKLPYVECSNPDGQSQTQICIDNKIQSYPTWQFADGTRVTGEQTLQQLADKSKCQLPATSDSVTTAPVTVGSSTPVSQ